MLLYSTYTHCRAEDVAPKLDSIHWSKDQSIQMKRDEIERASTFEYDIAVGSLPISSEDKKDRAEVSYIAYFKKKSEIDSKETAPRPVAFCFNGGPGSSSVWLHLGGLGPKKIEIPEISWSKQQQKIVDNPFSLLQTADLVFIDPVGTGFSRSAEGADEKKFLGIDEDIESLTLFLESFIRTFQLWSRPKILIGESYGAFRVAGLASSLLNRYYISCDGIALISGTIDFRDIESPHSSDFCAISPIPTYAATAHYFGKLSSKDQQKPLGEFLTEVETFCVQELTPALFVGDALLDQEKAQIAKKMHQYTGLSEELLLSHNLRIPPDLFAKSLFQNENSILGRFDSRHKTHTIAGLEKEWMDPSFYAVAPAFTSAMNEYLQMLCPEKQQKEEYAILSRSIRSWNWRRKADEPGLGYATTLPDMKASAASNPQMKFFVAAGIYDLALPYFGQELGMYRLSLPSEMRKNITIRRYRGGHMMYLNPISCKNLLSDLRDFVRNCSEIPKERQNS